VLYAVRRLSQLRHTGLDATVLSQICHDDKLRSWDVYRQERTFKREGQCIARGKSESFDFDVVLAQRITHLPRRKAEFARRFGLDPTRSFHGVYQALVFGRVLLVQVVL